MIIFLLILFFDDHFTEVRDSTYLKYNDSKKQEFILRN